MTYIAGKFDIAVIGAGHAGIEAALSCARLGCSVALFSLSLDTVGNLPCNPSIGGSAKGQLVREIDALGGEMARAADECCIQYRMLNLGKGPSVHAIRAQADRTRYHIRMKRTLENQSGVTLKQSEIVKINTEDGRASSVLTASGATYEVKAVIIASGTYLQGKLITGEDIRSGGPDGTSPANQLSSSLLELGIPLRRFKTGTPPRILGRSVDFTKLSRQDGDENMPPFSFTTTAPINNTACCWLTYTNPETHEILRSNLHRSPLFSGVIEGVGPRYCPSIEDKVVRFADKERHPVFLEPMGELTDEMYCQGLSSSMPEEVQEQVLHSIEGLENAVICRIGYAIEYDCCDPTVLLPTLELKTVKGIYGAGQFCGSSGYEEAAAQGLVAGINAALSVLGREPYVMERQGSYIGTLIDDLVTRGTNEPYRMMTSRSEVRMLLRQDNADMRLTPDGYKLGLISKERYENMLEKYRRIDAEIQRLERVNIPPSGGLNEYLTQKGSTVITTGIKLADLVRRPELSYEGLAPFDNDREVMTAAEREQVEISIKYEGYIRRQNSGIASARKMESTKLPEDIDYMAINGLRIEARQKLASVRPSNLGQASRISGVNPADITALMIWMKRTIEPNAP